MSIGRFSDTLAYVYLPTVTHSQVDSEAASKTVTKTYRVNQGQPRRGTRSDSSRPEDTNLGRTSLIRVFDRLHKAGVRSILRLHVEDREGLSHTDAAIETALQGRDSLTEKGISRTISVETWCVTLAFMHTK